MRLLPEFLDAAERELHRLMADPRMDENPSPEVLALAILMRVNSWRKEPIRISDGAHDPDPKHRVPVSHYCQMLTEMEGADFPD
jgi:hypothetical protein